MPVRQSVSTVPPTKKAPFHGKSTERGASARYHSHLYLREHREWYKKNPVPSDKGAHGAVPPCIILHILNADRRWAYCSFSPQLTGDTPLFHTGSHPPGSLSFPTGLIPVHRMVLITRYYNRHCSICQERGNRRLAGIGMVMDRVTRGGAAGTWRPRSG